MKKKLFKLMLSLIIFAGVSLSASSQIYVKIRPAAPVIVQSERPSSSHVWIGEEWNEEGGQYVYVGGHWATPPHPGNRYYKGHWNHSRRHGEQWIHGGWRR
jgi:hypothetical protein